MSVWENLECDCGNKVFALSDNCHNQIRVQCVHCRKERFWKVKVLEMVK